MSCGAWRGGSYEANYGPNYTTAMAVLALTVEYRFLSLSPRGEKPSEKDREKEKPPEKVRGQLPTHYKKLDLSDEQRNRILRLRASYKVKIDMLQKQIEELKADERETLEKVLTPEQLKRLRKLRADGGK